MVNILTSILFFSFLFGILLLSIMLGQYHGRHRIAVRGLGRVELAEGTVFALLGLLVAFSFSGAFDRFEARKIYITQEVNALETAYYRIDLLKPEVQEPVRAALRQYLDARIALYKKFSILNPRPFEFAYYHQDRRVLWQRVVAACKYTAIDSTTQLLVPAINNALDIATTRIAVNQFHPPFAVFFILVALAVIGSFLLGYSLANKKTFNYIFVYSYVLMMSFTIYLVVELEFPRVGIIRIDSFDEMLVNVRRQMD